jgi:hypothetical protein
MLPEGNQIAESVYEAKKIICPLVIDSGDAGAYQASLILSYCNGLCFGARYESSLRAQRNNHFT